MKFKTLQAWLDYIWGLHDTHINLGLARVKEVAERLDLLHPRCPVITIAGTNGKGSCVAALEAIYLAEGYRVGSFTSPYLFRFNEEFKIQGQEVTDEALCLAFEKIEAVRGDVRLTPFEFNTMAALEIFRETDLDVYLLEIGLGGRLDAVNIIDADAAIVASIAIDHADWLGDTRELIAREKAGVFRANRPAICGDFSPPETLVDYAKEIQARLCCQGKEFHFTQQGTTWNWQSEKTRLENLPVPSLQLQNMSTVLMTIEALQEKLPVSEHAIKQGLMTINLPGRIQVIPGDVTTIVDVSHNPAAAELLAKKLSSLPCQGKTYAVFSMLGDKDIFSTIEQMKEKIDEWHVAELMAKRKATRAVLEEAFLRAGVSAVKYYSDVAAAYQGAVSKAKSGDRIVVFGSFYTVAEALTPKHT